MSIFPSDISPDLLAVLLIFGTEGFAQEVLLLPYLKVQHHYRKDSEQQMDDVRESHQQTYVHQVKAYEGGITADAVYGCLHYHLSQIISIIRPSALTKVSGKRITTAYTWAEVTGWPSLRTCSFLRLMISAICSVRRPPFLSARTYNIASSIFITISLSSSTISAPFSVKTARCPRGVAVWYEFFSIEAYSSVFSDKARYTDGTVSLDLKAVRAG